MWPYRFAILAVVAGLQPRIEATTESGTPPSSILVTQVCLRSWKRIVTSVSFLTVSHDSFHDVMALVGSMS
jgi:hypothetical protein